jgi:hypothetical protein
MPYVENLQEFLQRHNHTMNDLVKIRPDYWLLPNGASVGNGWNGTAWADPPSDPKSRLEARKRYHLAKATIVENAFQHMKAALLGAGTIFQWREAEIGIPNPCDGKPAY